MRSLNQTLSAQVRAPAEGWAAGQGVFTPEGGVIFTAFSTEPIRLGVRFYNTRKSCLCYAPAPTFSTGFPPGTQGAKVSSAQKGPDQVVDQLPACRHDGLFLAQSRNASNPSPPHPFHPRARRE